jgi:hypothetical protein
MTADFERDGLARVKASNVFRSMFVTRLPNRSTSSTAPTSWSPTSGWGISSWWYVDTVRPSADSWIPLASHAAAGAKRSRPSKVRLTVGRAYLRSVNSTTRLGGMSRRNGGEHAIVGGDEAVIASLRRDSPAR